MSVVPAILGNCGYARYGIRRLDMGRDGIQGDYDCRLTASKPGLYPRPARTDLGPGPGVSTLSVRPRSGWEGHPEGCGEY